MATFKLSYKLMAGFLVVIFFLGIVIYYVQETENALWNERIKQAEILRLGESIAKHNLELFDYAQLYVLSDSKSEFKRIRSDFSLAYDALLQELDLLENTTHDKYSVGILKIYSVSIKSDFEKIAAIHDLNHLSNNSKDSVALEKEERNVLSSIEDAGVKVKGAREMILEQATRTLKDSAVRLEEQKEISRNMLWGMILLSIALSTYLTGSAVKWINKLRKGAIEIGKGNLDIRLDIKTHDEIGELGGAFNKMASDLKASRGELLLRAKDIEKAKIELQAKVDELERFNKMTVGRELKMVELKKRITELEGKIRGE